MNNEQNDSFGVRIPAPSEIDEYAQAHHANLFFEFASFAIQSRRPLRCWRTLRALLWIAKGRESFVTGVGRIMAISRQCRRSVQLALNCLDEDGWITRQQRRQKHGYWWTESRYKIRHFES